MSCDWLMEGQQLVTASWDHTAKLWDFESGQVIHSLEGEIDLCKSRPWFREGREKKKSEIDA